VTSDPLLSRQELEEALRALADQLRERKLAGQIYLFGGGALVLGFDARDAPAIWTVGSTSITVRCRTQPGTSPTILAFHGIG
jgi:hypothetical protein